MHTLPILNPALYRAVIPKLCVVTHIPLDFYLGHEIISKNIYIYIYIY